jgi:hypothetical protein
MEKLTLQMLKDMKPGVFAKGEVDDDSTGINISDSGGKLKWVAVRGEIHDWAIYVHFASMDFEWIRKHGDKIFEESNIKRLVNCDSESFANYRF